MIKSKKGVAGLLAVVMSATSVLFCLVGCESPNSGNVEMLNELADQLALEIVAYDAFGLNAFCRDPEGTFGVDRGNDNTWYSYSGKPSDAEILSSRIFFTSLYNDFKQFREDRFTGIDAVTYRSTKFMIETYRNYYNSKYVADFSLIGGGYINSEGGYVADFASSFENFIFRDATDVEILLEITNDTERAFGTYIAYAKDRAENGYPLHDSTLESMQSYLNDVYSQGEEYYLYEVADNKIDAVDFLTTEEKEDKKSSFHDAITDKFMKGVQALSKGLDAYKGNVVTTNLGYLASYKKVGKAYYEWMVGTRTGNFKIKIDDVYDELRKAYLNYETELDGIVAEVEKLKTTEPQTYSDFWAYVAGEKYIFDMTDPYVILDYLKEAAKNIVPDLNVTPEIDFKYMDVTVAEITSAVAYYVKSPVDETEAAEHITLNPITSVEDPSDLLTTIAHEGYPGHLYAHVRSKEVGTRLISTTNSCISFSEGWSQYVELALLDHIADTATDKALKLYAEYDKYYLLSAYINNVINDMLINYMGYGVNDFILAGVPASNAKNAVEYFMENPAVYVPYGYGMYYIYDLHQKAKTALGADYDEVAFNGALLSEGFGPTLPRALQITNDYIKSNKQ